MVTVALPPVHFLSFRPFSCPSPVPSGCPGYFEFLSRLFPSASQQGKRELINRLMARPLEKKWAEREKKSNQKGSCFCVCLLELAPPTCQMAPPLCLVIVHFTLSLSIFVSPILVLDLACCVILLVRRFTFMTPFFTRSFLFSTHYFSCAFSSRAHCKLSLFFHLPSIPFSCAPSIHSLLVFARGAGSRMLGCQLNWCQSAILMPQ